MALRPKEVNGRANEGEGCAKPPSLGARRRARGCDDDGAWTSLGSSRRDDQSASSYGAGRSTRLGSTCGGGEEAKASDASATCSCSCSSRRSGAAHGEKGEEEYHRVLRGNGVSSNVGDGVGDDDLARASGPAKTTTTYGGKAKATCGDGDDDCSHCSHCHSRCPYRRGPPPLPL